LVHVENPQKVMKDFFCFLKLGRGEYYSEVLTIRLEKDDQLGKDVIRQELNLQGFEICSFDYQIKNKEISETP
jgi:hypothetical protein